MNMLLEIWPPLFFSVSSNVSLGMVYAPFGLMYDADILNGNNDLSKICNW